MIGPLTERWRGSTDFRLLQLILEGLDIRPILQNRMAAGANLVRVLGMKGNNTGWELSPYDPRWWSAFHALLRITREVGIFMEFTVWADTRKLGVPAHDLLQLWHNVIQTLKEQDARHVVVERANEVGHPTQWNPLPQPERPDWFASNGSGLTDRQPPFPWWSYATYHARREPGYPNPKPAANWSPYVFRDQYPLPCPLVCEEGPKPEQYNFDPQYAALMGLHARAGWGGTFHHSAWNEGRAFTEREFACAKAFYDMLR